MNKQKQKLELNWIGKDNRPRLEPRIFLEDESLSYHAGSAEQALDQSKASNQTYNNNLLIHGDNLLALKALEQDYAGKVKCVFIDPPYNTGSAFEHYDDGLEHSMWLSMIRDRLILLRNLLSEDGSLWITIDDNEAHYLKVLCDEVFGRKNFVANCLWQKVYSERMDSRGFSNAHDHILVYQKSELFTVNQIPKEQNTKQFNFFDEAAGKSYRRRSLRKEGSESLRKDRPSMWYAIKAPDGTDIYPVKPNGIEGRWRWKEENVHTRMSELDFVEKENGWEVYVKQYLEEAATRPPSTWLTNEEVGHNHEAKLEVKAFNSSDVFTTPKPERLLERIIYLASKEGDLILDSFAGSGTTGAVAHKMGRRWIMVELGDHCETHIVPRLKKVIDGEDQGGISKSVNWQGGGGFRYLRLAPSLLKKDEWGNWVINKEYNADMLAAAMCKHMGFTYAPSDTQFWNQGFSTETDFIYTTTGSLAYDQLKRISDEVGTERTLLICCKAFMSEGTDFPNLTIKKIPQAILNKCEWDNDDYSFTLNVLADPTEDFEEEGMDDYCCLMNGEKKVVIGKEK